MCKSYLLLVMLISLVSSCIFKKDEVEEVTVKIPEETMSYFWPNVNDERVYVDSVSGVADSINLTYTKMFIDEDKMNVDYNFERFRLNTSSTINEIYFISLSSELLIRDSYCYGHINSKMVFVKGDDLNVGDTVENNNERIVFSNRYEKIKFAGIEYEEVLEFEKLDVPVDQEYIDSYPQFPVKTFFAKNIGLVRRENVDGSVWELKK